MSTILRVSRLDDLARSNFSLGREYRYASVITPRLITYQAWNQFMDTPLWTPLYGHPFSAFDTLILLLCILVHGSLDSDHNMPNVVKLFA